MVAKMLLMPLGKKPPLFDADRWRTVDDVKNLVHGACEADGIGRTGRNDRTRRGQACRQREQRLNRPCR